ncbi:MAG: DUF3159 domain-containing protein, partial [Actinomycetes bacterium]
TSWRNDPTVFRACSRSNWFWVGMYAGKLLIQVPLYAFNLVGLLGISKIALGYPPLIIVGWISYRMVKGPLAQMRERAAD